MFSVIPILQVTHTRLDCLYVSAALMQIAVAHACHHAAHRTAFGSKLVEKPLMRAVLCDLALEVSQCSLNSRS